MALTNPGGFLLAVLAFAAGITLNSALSKPAAASAQDLVRVVSGSTVALSTPPFIQVGKRYALTFPGGGPAQTHTIKQIRPDGWVLVEVADENLDPAFIVRGEVPVRWLNLGMATSIQEMRALPY